MIPTSSTITNEPHRTGGNWASVRTRVGRSQSFNIPASSPTCPNVPLTNFPNTADGWRRITNPLKTHHYFHHELFRVVTDENPNKDGRAKAIATKASLAGWIPPPGCERYYDESGEQYYIDHQKEILQIVHGELLPTDVLPDHMDACKSEYWKFVKEHPFHLCHPVPQSAIREAQNILTLLLATHTLEPRPPLSPFSKIQCRELLDMLSVWPQYPKHQSCNLDHRRFVVASVLAKIYAQRYWCDHQPNPSDYTPHGANKIAWLQAVKRWLKISAGFLLLGLPTHYEKRIKKAYEVRIDKDVPQHRWQEVMERLKVEWQLFMLIGILLLTCTISALAINKLDRWTALLMYLSAACAFFNIVIGMWVLWQHVGTLEEDGIARLLYFKRNPWKLAYLQSLPLATLVWGLAFFGFAGGLYPFTNSGEVQFEPAQRIIAGVALGILASTFLVPAIDVLWLGSVPIEYEERLKITYVGQGESNLQPRHAP